MFLNLIKFKNAKYFSFFLFNLGCKKQGYSCFKKTQANIKLVFGPSD